MDAHEEKLHELDRRLAIAEHAADERDQILRQISAELTEAVSELSAISARMAAVSHETHLRHHALWEEELELKKARRRFWEDQAKKLASGGLLAAFAGLGTVIWYAVTQFIKTTKGGG